MVHVLSDKARLPAQNVGDIGHVDFFADETLTVHVEVQEGVLVPHEARVKVVHDTAVGDRLHGAAGFDGEDVAITGAVIDLLVEVLDIRAETTDHGGVVLIGAGGENYGLGVELDEAAVLSLAYTADDAAVRVLDELDDRSAEVDFEVVILLLGVGQNAGDEGAVVVGLGSEPGGEDFDLVFTEVKGLGAVMHDTSEEGGSILILGDAGLVVFPLGLLGNAALFADELQSLFRTVDIGFEQLAIGTPAVDSSGEGEPLFQATLGGTALDDGGGAVTLGDSDGLLLQDGDFRTHLGCFDSGDDTGGTGTADHDVHIALFGKVGDRLENDCGSIDVFCSDVSENISTVRLDSGLDRAGADSFALGLGNAVLQGDADRFTGQGSAGYAIDVGALGSHNLSEQVIMGNLADGRGLFGKVQNHVNDGILIEGSGDGDGAHAGGSGGVGARRIEPGSGGLGIHCAETDTGHGERSGACEGTFQEISSAEVGHKAFFLS